MKSNKEYWHPGYGHAITQKEIKSADREFQKEIMEEWFLSNFENPAEHTPYETAEGGYIYIWGGPYDAEEELQNEFGGIVPDDVISEVVHELEDREGCHEWSGRPSAENYDDYVFDAIISNTQFYSAFQQSIDNIRELLDISVNIRLAHNYFMLLYVGVITALETYLSDAFINKIMADKDLLRRFVENNPDFAKQTLTVNKIFEKLDSIEVEVKSYLLDLTWHNLEKIKQMYKATLAVEFPSDLKDIFKGIIIRHDIVHRNGKTKEGREIQINKTDVDRLIDRVSAFVTFIDEQLAKNGI